MFFMNVCFQQRNPCFFLIIFLLVFFQAKIVSRFPWGCYRTTYSTRLPALQFAFQLTGTLRMLRAFAGRGPGARGFRSTTNWMECLSFPAFAGPDVFRDSYSDETPSSMAE